MHDGDADLELVLRGVDAALTEDELCVALAAQGFTGAEVTRFKRTRRGEAKPLPLLRVRCAGTAQRKALLQTGATLGGRLCAAEAPKAHSGSAAARGKWAAAGDAEVEALFELAGEIPSLAAAPKEKWLNTDPTFWISPGNRITAPPL